jgi:diacylglycerol kinase (ATP)
MTSSTQSSTSRPFEFTGRLRSFAHAARGVLLMIRRQHNAWIHALATIVVVAAGFSFQLSGMEWCWVVLAISAVWTAEALNTAFEFPADVASPEFHPTVRDAKDVAAGAVLVTAIAAATVGGLVFWPHISKMFEA